METTPSSRAAAVDAFTAALLASFAQLSMILETMYRHAAENPNDGPPPSVVFDDLIRSVISDACEDYEIGDLAVAAQMVGATTRTIGNELFVVDVSRLAEEE